MSEADIDYLSKQPENTFKAAQQLVRKYQENPNKNLIAILKQTIIDKAFSGHTYLEFRLEAFESQVHEMLNPLFLEGFQIYTEWIETFKQTIIKISWSLEND